MKKILLIIMMMLICITNVSAKEDEYFYYNEEKVDNMWITRTNAYFSRSANPYILKRKSDNSYVYCIEPFSQLDSTSKYIVDNDYTKYGITKEQIDRINLITYYGYGYKNHTDKKWYGITQYMIWKTVNPNDIFYFSREKDGKNENLYLDEINEIEKLIVEHNKVPNFLKEYIISTNTNLEITSNIDLDDYNIVTDLKYQVVDNKFIFENISIGEYEVKLIKKNDKYKSNYLLYYSKNSQNIIIPGNSDNYNKEYSFKIISKEGKVTFDKVNSITNEKLEGATYGIYSDNNLIASVKTDKNGIGKIDLPFGNYVIKELEAPAGYKIDNKEYSFSIDKDNLNIELHFKDDKIVIKVPDTGIKSNNKYFYFILVGVIGLLHGKKKYKVY